ncbi:PREDICTED: neuromedin-S [Rhinopithecus bieti]|uniref:neuromedin-S n=1 Tax=Rhinopithecus bieti TaxID=61621 RepID=UPI00083BED06|nr:PREDICTED: neuromedin-S [Rhinopithecus bieti]
MQDRGLSLPVDLGEMRSSCPSSIRLWPARRNQTLTMKPLRPQFPVILVIYCFCMLHIPSSGFPQPLADPPDGLDIVQLEQLAYCLSQWASLSRQPKDNQDIYKRFLFHYSRTQEATHPIKTGFPPVHPLMHLAAKLATRRMKRFLQRGSGTAAVDFTKKDHAATWGRPFFLFRPRNGRNTEDEAQ